MKRPIAVIPLTDGWYYTAREADAYMDHLEAENKRLSAALEWYKGIAREALEEDDR